MQQPTLPAAMSSAARGQGRLSHITAMSRWMQQAAPAHSCMQAHKAHGCRGCMHEIRPTGMQNQAHPLPTSWKVSTFNERSRLRYCPSGGRTAPFIHAKSRRVRLLRPALEGCKQTQPSLTAQNKQRQPAAHAMHFCDALPVASRLVTVTLPCGSRHARLIFNKHRVVI